MEKTTDLKQWSRKGFVISQNDLPYGRFESRSLTYESHQKFGNILVIARFSFVFFSPLQMMSFRIKLN